MKRITGRSSVRGNRAGVRFIEELEGRRLLAGGPGAGTWDVSDNGGGIVVAAADEVAAPTITVGLLPAAPVGGESAFLQITVTLEGGAPAQGTVTYNIDDRVTPTFGQLQSGAAQLHLGTLPVGEHTVIVSYLGYEQTPRAESAPFTFSIPKGQTETTLSVMDDVVTYPQLFGFTATVRVPGGGFAYPIGKVRFLVDGASDGQIFDVNGHYTSREIGLPPGVHTVRAEFLGSEYSEPSLSEPVTVTVHEATPPPPTVTRRVLADGRTRLSVAVKHPSGDAPRGTVTLREGTNVLGTLTLDPFGKASLTLPATFAGGNHTVVARYSGNENFEPAVSNPYKFTNKPLAATKVSLSATKLVTSETPLVLTATLKPFVAGQPVPTGKVVFRDGTQVLGSAKLVDGMARLKHPAVFGGTHEITASYLGDAKYGRSLAVAARLDVLSPAVVDVMVLYTAEAAAVAGGDLGIAQAIRTAVADANAAFRNSRINAALRLVSARKVTYGEVGDLNLDLDRVTLVDDGHMDEIHQWRDDAGADLVSLWVGRGDGGGVSFQFEPQALGANEAYAFSVIDARLADGPDYVFAHEIGHNLGADHDKDHLQHPPSYPFSRGHRFIAAGQKYRDIMSYEPGVVIPYFSNPNVKYKGVATGKGGFADAARAINLAAPTAAGYRLNQSAGALRPKGSLDSGILGPDKPVVLTANLSTSHPTLVPTGLVLFLDGEELIGFGRLKDGKFTLKVTLGAGRHDLAFYYEGDLAFQSAVIQGFSLTI